MGNAVSDPLRPQRPPISGNEGLQALNRAERIDNYIGQVNASQINVKAREGTTYLPSPHSISRSIPAANEKEPWPNGQVVWMDSTADAGLPHTRPPFFICLASNFPQDKLDKTLVHERVHVSQRLHTSVWIEILKKAWDMTPWTGEIPPSLLERQRINPDLLFAPLFAWKAEFVPLAVFKSSIAPKLNEVDLVWWNPKTKTVFRAPPPGWLEFFGSSPHAEHPFEIAAYLIADRQSNITAYKKLTPYLSSLPTTEV